MKKRRGKVYYFTCRDCGERKPQAEEVRVKPGLCVVCYQKPEYEPHAH